MREVLGSIPNVSNEGVETLFIVLPFVLLLLTRFYLFCCCPTVPNVVFVEKYLCYVISPLNRLVPVMHSRAVYIHALEMRTCYFRLE